MFDSQIFFSQRFGGISRYVSSLALELGKIQDVRPLIVAPFHQNDYLERLPKWLVSGKKMRWSGRAMFATYVANAVASSVVRRHFRPDILHHTYYYPVKRVARVAQVVTVYDLIHEKYPSQLSASSSFARWKARCVAQADHVICISENTRRDVLERYGIDERRVSVTYLGYDTLEAPLNNESSSAFRSRVFGGNTPYLLYVGVRVGYKNFEGLLQAYASSTWLKQNFSLLCFGGGEFTGAERLMMAQLDIANRIKQVGGADSVLASCYAHASLFVYPSYYEGFGLPPLEAMSLDCPVACSNTSSLPEVVGDAAILFDPVQPESIRIALETILGSPSLRETVIARARVQRSRFSWKKCAANTENIYRNLLGS